MASSVAWGAAEFEFVDVGVAGFFVGGVVVVFGEGGAAAVDAAAVSFFDDAFLSGGGVSLSAGGVDWFAFRVVDEGAYEGVRCDLFDVCLGNGCAVVEGAAVSAYVNNDFAVRFAR